MIPDIDLDHLLDPVELETTRTLTASQRHARPVEQRHLLRIQQKRAAAREILTELPLPGHSWHIVSNAAYDYWTWIPVLIDLLGGRIDSLYCSTWTMSRHNVTELFELFDAQKIARVSMLTGIYFKRRESAVYATLLSGLLARGQRYLAFENHTKISLLAAPPHYITIEGSANLTANPRLEQYVMSNDQALHAFHVKWMEEIYATP